MTEAQIQDIQSQLLRLCAAVSNIGVGVGAVANVQEAAAAPRKGRREGLEDALRAAIRAYGSPVSWRVFKKMAESAWKQESGADADAKASVPVAKKKPSEYNNFIRDNMKRVREEHPDISQGSRMKILAKLWRDHQAAAAEIPTPAAPKRLGRKPAA